MGQTLSLWALEIKLKWSGLAAWPLVAEPSHPPISSFPFPGSSLLYGTKVSLLTPRPFWITIQIQKNSKFGA